jgi:hypothetical protein
VLQRSFLLSTASLRAPARHLATLKSGGGGGGGGLKFNVVVVVVGLKFNAKKLVDFDHLLLSSSQKQSSLSQ